MRSWGNVLLLSPPAPATLELFLAREEDSVSHLLPALPARKTWSFPQLGLRGRDGPGQAHATGKVLYLRLHALLILHSFKTTIIPDKRKSGKQTNKQKGLIQSREKQDFSAQTLSQVIVSGEPGQLVGFAAASVSISLSCIALVGYFGLLPAHTVPGRTGKSKK